MTRTALIIIQTPSSDPGRVGAFLRQRGFDLDVRCPNEGGALPERLDGIDAVVVFGGPMSANDSETMAGIQGQLDFLPAAMDSGTPVLGICLGAQLMARSLGAPITRHPQGSVEIGYHEITPTPEGEGLFGGPMHVFQWHREGFEAPRGATLLARGTTFANQAFRYGEAAYGLQFHPEAGRSTIERWTEAAAHDLVLPGAHPRDAQLADFERHDPAADRWLRHFFDHVFPR